MQEILPGIWHWTAEHPGIGQRVSSYAVPGAGLALDPLLPEGGAERLKELHVTNVALTCRHHRRHAPQLQEALGGRVVRAARLMHGKTDTVAHDGAGVFRGLPERVRVMRYHSLAIERASLPAELAVTATSDDGEIMGVRHRAFAGTRAPLEGVQFHPESFLTEHGQAMLRNFLTEARTAA